MARKFWLTVAIFVMALTLGLSNAPLVFVDRLPRIAPFDELYHWKRITWSAQHFPQVLENDRDRGEGGAFCPWPPLYDLGAAAAARVFGASSASEVLWRIIWIPPMLSAAAIAVTAWFVMRHFGMLAGTTVGIALAASPFLVTQSSIGNIDHHFLEWPLTFAIIGSVALAIRGHPRAGFVLAASMIVAMLTQTALLIACGLAFLVLFAVTDGGAAAVAFSATTVIIAIFRMTRPPGYPDSPWFMGWPHVALFAGAAVASAYLFSRGRRAPALLLGIATVFAVPSAPASILTGLHFFGGDRWLETIIEFQPMWKGQLDDLASLLAGLSAGAILVWLLAIHAIRHRDYMQGTIALYAIMYLLLTISNRRFWSVGVPLLALAGAVCAATVADRRQAIFAAAAVALIPAVQLALWMQHPKPLLEPQQLGWIRTALFLRKQPRASRVLAPWSLGHVLDVIGERAVIIDNFGTMPDPIAFDRANDALLARDEAALARYCDQSGTRSIVIDNPIHGLRAAAAAIGLDPEFFVNGRSLHVTPLGRATWWWRVYFNRGRPFRQFRLIYADPEPSSLMVWEYVPDVR